MSQHDDEHFFPWQGMHLRRAQRTNTMTCPSGWPAAPACRLGNSRVWWLHLQVDSFVRLGFCRILGTDLWLVNSWSSFGPWAFKLHFQGTLYSQLSIGDLEPLAWPPAVCTREIIRQPRWKGGRSGKKTFPVGFLSGWRLKTVRLQLSKLPDFLSIGHMKANRLSKVLGILAQCDAWCCSFISLCVVSIVCSQRWFWSRTSSQLRESWRILASWLMPTWENVRWTSEVSDVFCSWGRRDTSPCPSGDSSQSGSHNGHLIHPRWLRRISKSLRHFDANLDAEDSHRILARYDWFRVFIALPPHFGGHRTWSTQHNITTEYKTHQFRNSDMKSP